METSVLCNKRVVVTGGAGFIGSELVRQLTEGGAFVVVVDNLINGRRENVESTLNARGELVVADIRDTERMAAVLSGADIVYHLACLGVRHSIHSPLENHQVNADATLRLLGIARERAVGKFVNVSTSEVYGTTFTVPMNEAHPTLPKTVYGASKLAGECYARAYWETYRYPTVVVRPFNAYGPRSHHEGDSGEVIPKFMLRALAGKPMIVHGDGSQTRDFTFVGDTARGILLAGVCEGAVGRTLNLATGREIAISELAGLVRAVLDRPAAEIAHGEPRPGDVLRLCGDAQLAASLLAYSPTTTLREGLSALRDWYAAQGVAPEVLLERELVKNWEGGARP